MAHITRCSAIANKLSDFGYETLFALSKSKQYLIKNKKIKVLDIEEFFGDEEDLTKLKNPSHYYPLILEEIELLKKYQPDLAILDYRFSAIISCKKVGIPTVSITNSDGLPPNIYLPSFGIPRLVQKTIDPLLQKFIWTFKKGYFTSFLEAGKIVDLKLDINDLFNGTIIVPEPPDYLPHNKNLPNVYYVGCIDWKGSSNKHLSWLKNIRPDGRTIYLTFGGTGYDSKKLVNLSEELVDKGYRVIVSSSNIAEPDDFKKIKNLYVEKFLPGFEVCKRVDLVVCHGGVGTLFQALSASRPVVIIPFNPDQYVHGFRFQELGLGKCVTIANVTKFLGIDWQDFQNLGRSLPLDKIIKVIDQVIEERDHFKDSLEKYRKKFTRVDGAKNAAKVIQGLLE